MSSARSAKAISGSTIQNSARCLRASLSAAGGRRAGAAVRAESVGCADTPAEDW
jgi:hypothetical protein